MEELQRRVGDAGAIGTAEFTGVRLADVLAHAGLDQDAAEKSSARHVQFEGLDSDIEGTRYGASVPLDRAVNPRADIILAWAMNGEQVPWPFSFASEPTPRDTSPGGFSGRWMQQP